VLLNSDSGEVDPTAVAAAATASINRWSVPPEAPGARRLDFHAAGGATRLTHQLFRFPAKFHPPVVGRLIADYTEPGQRIVDIFCGSGTLLVEASVSDRHAVGFDVDPLSVFLSQVKAQPLDIRELREGADRLLARCDVLARSDDEYHQRMHEDLSEGELVRQLGDLTAPSIPNLMHWFRRYVIVDLARLRHEIDILGVSRSVTNGLLLVFASIIRGASNADPVPVSGLERTRHMLERDVAGRLVNPFTLFRRRLRRALDDFEQYQQQRYTSSVCRAQRTDATQPLPLGDHEHVDAVLTSPPYHGAVDYYRRHQLETFWLRLTRTQQDRLVLLDGYLGRPHVPQRHRFVQNTNLEMWPSAATCERVMRDQAPRRADEFRHYCVGMARTFQRLADVLPAEAPAIFVVGHSRWNGEELHTSRLFSELAGAAFELDEELWYPVKNRHMSYGRHNGANIDREFVLVLRRTTAVAASLAT
jgi:hypothetical protein